jgi:hypothetical protein
VQKEGFEVGATAKPVATPTGFTRYHVPMAKQDFYEFFLPSRITDRKSAARAVAAGFFAGFIMSCVFGAVALILLVRDGGTRAAIAASVATIVMVLVTAGTWKRFLAAPVIGLVVTAVTIAWEIYQGGKVAAIVLIVPLMGGFFTAARGIAALKRNQ